MVAPRVVYVDEVQKDLSQYSALFGAEGELEIIGLPPPRDLDVRGILGHKPDLVLIDYELTKAQGEEPPATYMGGTLATKLREASADFPVVLLTRKSLLRDYRGAVGQLGAFDYEMFKDEVNADPERSRRDLISLCLGYGLLRGARGRDWRSLVEVLGCTPSESENLRGAAPPLVPSPREGVGPVWTIPGAAQWIIKVLIEYPGVLWDSLNVGCALGIEEQSFVSPTVQKVFSAALYAGPFSRFRPRWWADRIRQIGYNFLEKASAKPPLPQNFSAAFLNQRHEDLRPSVCVFSGEIHAEAVCYILRAPVKREYSLEYFPDSRPPAMEPARVSFKAIIEDARVKDDLFPADAQPLLESIRKGVIPGGQERTPQTSES